MTQKVTPTQSKKRNPVLGAISDLIILCLMLAGAGFGGYFWGIHQQLAPVLKVGPGTPGTEASAATDSQPQASSNSSNKTEGEKSASNNLKPIPEKSHGKRKYWISSSGTDYTGYSITVKVNDTPVDNFFGPGKNIDITRLVKPGVNSVDCEAKELGEQYNKHKGESNSQLILRVVSGPHLSDSYKDSDVLLIYKRNAAESEDYNDTLHFTGE